MESQIDLTGLKPLHFPVRPDIWPLAWGWYVIFGIILVIALILIYRRMESPLTYAERELKKIQKASTDKQLKLLSQLLKRVAMVRHGREAIAPLKEEAWQAFLLASAPNILTKEEAHLLAYAIYNPAPLAPDKKLFFTTQKWIEQVLKNPR